MGDPAQRVRREPEGTVLYRAVQAAWAPFVAEVAAGERAVPRFCRREVEGFLRCGILAHGFARVHCDDCGKDDVVAFSCKGRGFCPSCGGGSCGGPSWVVRDGACFPIPEKHLRRCIAKVQGDIERMVFNTAIAAMMIFVNEATKRADALSRDQLQRFVQILAPFAPPLAEELWLWLSGQGLLAYAKWPAVDAAMLVDDSVEIAVRVLGKVRGRAVVAVGASNDVLLAAACAAVASQLEGKTVQKEIVVPGKLVNFVVK